MSSFETPLAHHYGFRSRRRMACPAEGAVWAMSAESRTGRDGRVRADNIQLHVGTRGRDGGVRWERFDPRRWDSGASAESDEIGNLIIETVGTVGASLIARLIARVGTRVVGALTVRALDAVSERLMRGLAGAVDDAIVSGARESIESGVPRVVASAERTAAEQWYGPYTHHINHGGLESIVEGRMLRAGQQGAAGFGGRAVRAYSSDPALLDPSRMSSPAIVFRTRTPPSGGNPGQSAVFWEVDELNIVIDLVIQPGAR